MKRKIKYKNFKVSRAGEKYLNYRLDNVHKDYPGISSCSIRVIKEDNCFKARITGKYVKIDVTEKWSGPIFLVCINKLITAFEDKLNLVGYRNGMSLPVSVQRSSIFKEVV